ncbi:DUF3939 domain-containing protein [Paenibacillus sp. CECT 9249]|uniref:DUF3939 domain-containing protein n=1 Tax=unclassified Paenibacillus TaxID=185978 RepID=UPI001E4D9A5F|nr:DUF3939 domain-containing protein [Paenibacillus sp. CECT 9249]CAH0118735.1 hypothetical protein PAE9249_01229 [Paenibacillus sp. CECT 9249]
MNALVQRLRVHTRLLRLTALFAALAVAATGCLYPDELRGENKASYRDSVLLVQNAVDEYLKNEGLLPIFNSTQETPKYEKFRINFEDLVGKQYLSAIPSAAFEKGGHGYFIIIDEETNPTVRIMDLVTAQLVNDLQKAVDKYAADNKGDLPRGEEAYPGYYWLDLDKIGLSKRALNSVFSGEAVRFMLGVSGNVYVDYAPDIMQAIEKSGQHPTDPTFDLRTLLTEASYFVPVKSVPYFWVDGEPRPAKL